MRAKNSNITIERFLKDETYRLRTINDDIGKDLRTDITEKTKALQEIISAQAAVMDSENETNIDNALSNFDIEKYTAETDGFYTETELNKDVEDALYPDEFQSIYDTLNTYKETYDFIYTNTYQAAYKFYDDLKKASNKSQYTKESDLQAQIDSLDEANKNIVSNLQNLDQLRSGNYDNYIKPYKQRAWSAFNGLQSGIQSLELLYKTILPEYQAVAASTSATQASSISVKEILAFVYTNEYDKTQIKRIQTFLSGQQEILLNANTDEEEKLKNLAEFIEIFNDFAKYAELKK